MSPILLIINFISLAYAIILLMVVNRKFKLFFLLGCLLPIPFAVFVNFLIKGEWLGIVEIVLFFLRGGLVASILSGTLVNFLLSRINKKFKNKQIKDNQDGINR